ncbi:MAG: tetratricopeptide repeat protein [Spirochaetota bacterium]
MPVKHLFSSYGIAVITAFILISGFFFCGPVSSAGEDGNIYQEEYSSPAEMIDAGYKLMKAGKLKEAVEMFEYVKHKISPMDRQLYPYLARGFRQVEEKINRQRYLEIIHKADRYLDQERFEDAGRLYRFARKFYPEGKTVQNRLARLERAFRDYLQNQKVQQMQQKARRLFDEGRLERSREKWEEILQVDPHHEQARIYISKIEFKKREKHEHLLMAENYYRNGVLLFQQKNYREAIEQFENAAAMDYQTEQASTYIERCRKALKEQKRKQLEETESKVVHYLREGIKYYNLSQFRKSLAVLNKAYKLDPENTQIKEYMLRDIISLKREEEKHVPETSPFYPLIKNLQRLGLASYREGDYQQSVKYWEEILLIFPFNLTARQNLARVLDKTDPALAEEILKSLYQEAVSLVGRNKKTRAITKLKLIQEVRPGFASVEELLHRLEKEEKEQNQKDVVAPQEQKQARQLYRTAMEMYRQELPRQSVQLLNKALQKDPEFMDARLLLARAELRVRSLEQAASGGSAEDKNKDQELRIRIKKHYLEGVTLFMNGLYREAISEWEEVLRLEPSHEDAVKNIQRAKQRIQFQATGSSS